MLHTATTFRQARSDQNGAPGPFPRRILAGQGSFPCFPVIILGSGARGCVGHRRRSTESHQKSARPPTRSPAPGASRTPENRHAPHRPAKPPPPPPLLASRLHHRPSTARTGHATRYPRLSHHAQTAPADKDQKLVESSYGAGRWVPGWGHLFDDDADADSDVERVDDTLAMLTESDQIAGVTNHATVTLTKPTGHPSSTDDRDTPESVTKNVAVPPTVANTRVAPLRS